MELHGIQPTDLRKEITCRDCGHSFLIAQGQSSAACQACGNIVFLGAAGERVESLSREILQKRILPRLEEKGLAPDPLASFRAPASGARVDEIRIQYQVEWHLWAALVQKFHDPAFHMAYLTQAAANGTLNKAAERYQEHRTVMASLSDSRWQSEIADLMLARVESLAFAQLERERSQGLGFFLPMWMKVMPWRGPLMRFAWVAVGFCLMARVLLSALAA